MFREKQTVWDRERSGCAWRKRDKDRQRERERKKERDKAKKRKTKNKPKIERGRDKNCSEKKRVITKKTEKKR